MSIEIESMPYCWIDGKPIDTSGALKVMIGLCGKEVAVYNFTCDQRLNQPQKDRWLHKKDDTR